MSQLSVVMPVYNQEKYVDEAVNCILRQTFTNFEFIIVDDGSTDNTLSILREIKDQRINLIQANHDGFLAALVKGVSSAKGKWIARMDSDDICHPERLEKQLAFLKEHPECCFVTTTYGVLTPNNCYLKPDCDKGWRYLEPKDITLANYLFCDPSTVFDREQALAIGYDFAWENEKPLWYGLLKIGEGALLEDPLYYIRWLLGSHSRSQSGVRSEADFSIRAKYDPETFRGQQRKPFDASRKSLRVASKCIKYYLAADDFIAADGTATQLLKEHPFNIDAWKLKLRTVARINGDLKKNLKRSKFSFSKVDSPW